MTQEEREQERETMDHKTLCYCICEGGDKSQERREEDRRT